MATIQIRGVQIQNGSIGPTQIDLTGTYDFGSGVLRVGTPSGTTDVANKAYVDAQLPDAFSGGDGIAINTSGDPDVISVDLATNPGMQFTSNKLDLKVKSESGGSITKDGDGIYIADSAISSAKLAGSIANAKLANSTISGVALGANLAALAAGNGLAIGSAYTGASGQTMDLNLDGSSLAKGGSGVKVADDGITATQIADNAVVSAGIASNAVITSKIAAAAVDEGKLSIEGSFDVFAPNGSVLAFALTNRFATGFEPQVMAFKNGLLMRLVASSPADADQYTVTDNGSVSTVTFGANLTSGDSLEIRYMSKKS